MDRNYLAGTEGDAANAVLAGAGKATSAPRLLRNLSTGSPIKVRDPAG